MKLRGSLRAAGAGVWVVETQAQGSAAREALVDAEGLLRLGINPVSAPVGDTRLALTLPLVERAIEMAFHDREGDAK